MQQAPPFTVRSHNVPTVPTTPEERYDRGLFVEWHSLKRRPLKRIPAREEDTRNGERMGKGQGTLGRLLNQHRGFGI